MAPNQQNFIPDFATLSSFLDQSDAPLMAVKVSAQTGSAEKHAANDMLNPIKQCEFTALNFL